MKLDRPALRFAIGFFLVWLCVLYLGADHPPPPGFLWVVVLDLVAALLVYRRVTTYAEWHAARRPRRVVRVLRDGALTGLAFGMLALLFSATRSGGAAALDWEPALVWLVVLTLVGSANTALLYAFISLTGGKGAGEGTKSVGWNERSGSATHHPMRKGSAEGVRASKGGSALFPPDAADDHSGGLRDRSRSLTSRQSAHISRSPRAAGLAGLPNP